MMKLRPVLALAVVTFLTAAYGSNPSPASPEFSRNLRPTDRRELKEDKLESLRPTKEEVPSSMLKKSARMEAAAPGIITELPEDAVYYDYDRDGVGYYYLYGSVNSEYLVARQSEIYIAGNDVYLKNPVIDLPTDTYIKGTIDEEGMTFQLPQPIDAYEWDGVWYYTYASMMNLANSESGNLTYVVPENQEENVLTFKRDKDLEGKFTMMDTDDGYRILGTSNDYDYWTGYGEYDIVYTLFDTPLVTPPAGIELKQYILPWKTASARMIHIGFDGNDCYIQGLSQFAPEGWVKGQIQDGKIVLPSGQYVGINYDWDLRSRLFFHAAEMKETWVEWAQDYYLMPDGIDDMTFNFDKTLDSYISSQTVGFTTGNAPGASFYEYFSEPTLRFQPEEISLVPATPIFKDYYPLSSSEGQCLHFIIPDLDIDGYLLNHNNLYYRVWVNGEPYVWERSEYPTIPEETMEWMHVDMDDWWDFMTHTDYISIVVYVLGMDTFGVQSCYFDGVERYESDVMTFAVDDPLSVEMVENHGEIKNVRYLDLSGKPASHPSHGLFIRMTEYSDGSVTATKVSIN